MKKSYCKITQFYYFNSKTIIKSYKFLTNDWAILIPKSLTSCRIYPNPLLLGGFGLPSFLSWSLILPFFQNFLPFLWYRIKPSSTIRNLLPCPFWSPFRYGCRSLCQQNRPDGLFFSWKAGKLEWKPWLEDRIWFFKLSLITFAIVNYLASIEWIYHE